MKKTPITVTSRDIGKIGNGAYERNGNVSILCDNTTAMIEELFLGHILSITGHEITEIVDYIRNEKTEVFGPVEIEIRTTMPWSQYCEITAQTI